MNQSTLFLTSRQLHLLIRSLLKKKSLIAVSGTAIALILILALLLIPTDVTAQKLHTTSKQIVSVQINKGDTLWSIAGRYITTEYKDMNTYIKEIKETNGLTTDTIHEGSYIIVPYYK